MIRLSKHVPGFALACAILLVARAGSAQTPPPHLSFSVGGVVGSDTLHEMITACSGTTPNNTTWAVTFNGATVTSSFPLVSGGTCTSGSPQHGTGIVTPLLMGTNTMTAHLCDLGTVRTDPPGCVTNTLTFTHDYVQVTPKNATGKGVVNEPDSVLFTVQNLRPAASTFALTVTCSGTGVSACTAPSSITVPASSSSPVPVHFNAGALNSTGTMQLKAVYTANTAAKDSGAVIFTAQWNSFLSVNTSYTNQEDQDVGLCAQACFANALTVSTVPYISSDTPRRVTLAYNSDGHAVRPIIRADVTMAAGAQAVQEFQLQAQVNGSFATFTNGETILHFSAVPVNGTTMPFRLAGVFDASTLTSGAYGLKLIVTAIIRIIWSR